MPSQAEVQWHTPIQRHACASVGSTKSDVPWSWLVHEVALDREGLLKTQVPGKAVPRHVNVL